VRRPAVVLWDLEPRRDVAYSPAAELAHLSAMFAASVGALDQGGQRAAVRVGLEHEYCVFDAGRQVDFATLIHGLSLGVRHLDPADPNAYWLPSGAAITCDEQEAEVALPPTKLRPGFVHSIQARANAAQRRLAELLPPGLVTEGYSTHVSISTPVELGERVALTYVRRFAPALMLVMNGRQTPGLLVRPRPGRTELCGEFVEQACLRAAVAFAVGSTEACVQAVSGTTPTGTPLPPEIDIEPERARVRYGWYVDRRAFGADLHRDGRETQLRLVGGGTIGAQRHLELAWESARTALGDRASAADLATVDQMIANELPLPGESRAAAEIDPASTPGAMTLAQGDARRPRRRPGFELAPVMVTWNVTVYLVVDVRRERRAFVCVPSPNARRFLFRLLRGDLDDILDAYLRLAPAGRKLDQPDRTKSLGIYDDLAPRRWLLPLEIDPHARAVPDQLSARPEAAAL
jgi:hypothetical protein